MKTVHSIHKWSSAAISGSHPHSEPEDDAVRVQEGSHRAPCSSRCSAAYASHRASEPSTCKRRGSLCRPSCMFLHRAAAWWANKRWGRMAKSSHNSGWPHQSTECRGGGPTLHGSALCCHATLASPLARGRSSEFSFSWSDWASHFLWGLLQLWVRGLFAAQGSSRCDPVADFPAKESPQRSDAEECHRYVKSMAVIRRHAGGSVCLWNLSLCCGTACLSIALHATLTWIHTR